MKVGSHLISLSFVNSQCIAFFIFSFQQGLWELLAHNLSVSLLLLVDDEYHTPSTHY